MKLGARVMKTALAMTIAIYICRLFEIEAATYGGFAAALAIQPNIYRSFQTTMEQFYANFIGVGIGVAVIFALENEPVVIGFSVIIVIAICMYFKMSENTISLAIFALLAVMETTELTILHFGGVRFLALSIGILSAFFVNTIFLPPRYDIRLFKSINQMTTDILQWIRISTRHLSDNPALRVEIDRLQRELRQIDTTYLLFSEERIYSRKTRMPKLRKLVIFRQMINTSRRSLDTLESFHHYDDKVEEIPKEFQRVLVSELDKIIYAHERLMLSAMGKIKKNPTKPIEEITDPDIPRVAQTVINIYKHGESERMSLLPLASRLMEYHRELLHLQKLLNSSRKFHTNLSFTYTKKRKNILPSSNVNAP
ncbi:FUSC family protein [Gracilibacillus sp. HCP3S3_G5_1]|uniref:FUSC family protein n=1 Tax=unclassified Gracilibacillus TaxID=2625209 RepID=UPI003F8B1200